MSIMKIFYVDYSLFQRMKQSNNVWETLIENSREEFTLRGGLDHIEETKKQFIFHDIGCNGIDLSFIIRSQNQ